MKSLRIFDTHDNYTLPSTVPSVTYCVQQEELHWGGGRQILMVLNMLTQD